MSVAFHRSPRDWLMSDKILDEATAAILRDTKIVWTFDVPYVAGYSKDGKTFYIDRKLPPGFEHPGGLFRIENTLILHEAIEKGLEDEIPSLPYQLAHQVALRGEEAAVRAAKVSWVDYNTWFMKQIRSIGNRALYEDCPPDLDLKPYLDEEDWETLEKMFASGKPLWDGRKVHPGVV